MFQNKTRLIIIPEMIPHIVEKYDEYYNKTKKINIQEVGNELNCLFTDLFGNEYNFDESAYRKTYKNIKNGIDLSLKNNFSEEEILRIAQARNKLSFEKRIANKERQEASGMINKVADNSIMKETILESINNYQFNEILEIKNIKKENNGIPVYVFTDVHYGLITDIFSNKYDTDIAKERLTNFFSYVLSDVKENKYKQIYIIDEADMIEGSCLRISQLVNISQLIIEQSLEYTDVIRDLTISLASKIKDCEINFGMITDSNHTQIRHFSGKPNEFNKEDFALIIANLLNEKFKNIKNVKFNFGDIIFTEINEYRFAFIHGHQNMGNDEIEYIKKIYGKDIDSVIRGHYHCFQVKSYNMKLNECGCSKQQFIITSPSVCGNTDYAVKKGYSAQPSALKVLISKDGDLEGINLIKL